jgi:DNA polymerase/3'-5' exonuclease PolX
LAKDASQDSQTSLPGVMETVDVRFTRARAIHAASRLKPILLKYVLRGRDGKPLCRLAGSLRRRAREVHDIDVVACVSMTPEDLMTLESNPRARLRAEITARAGKILFWGPDHARFTFEEIPVDLYFTKPSRFAVALLIATGSAQHLRRLDLRAKARNLHLQPAQHLLATNDYTEITLGSESDVYQTLGVPYQSPQQRA